MGTLKPISQVDLPLQDKVSLQNHNKHRCLILITRFQLLQITNNQFKYIKEKKVQIADPYQVYRL